jgi:sulfate/thiosulfate transport system permease protein
MHPSSMRTKKTVGAMVANEPMWLRALLISAAFGIIGVLILVPLVYVFVQAFSDGWSGYIQNLWNDSDTRHSG